MSRAKLLLVERSSVRDGRQFVPEVEPPRAVGVPLQNLVQFVARSARTATLVGQYDPDEVQLPGRSGHAGYTGLRRASNTTLGAAKHGLGMPRSDAEPAERLDSPAGETELTR